MRHRSLIGSPVVAAALSFLFPGLGQAAAGDRRRGVIVAIPVLATLAGFTAILIFDRSSLFGLALNQGWLTSLLILDLVAFIYHLWAIVDSYLLARKAQPEERRVNRSAAKWAPILGVVIIMTGAIGVHAGVAEVDMSWQHALYCVTAITPCWVTDNPVPQDSAPTDDEGGDALVTDSPGASGSVESIAPVTTFNMSLLPSFATPSGPWAWNANGQFNVLLVGLGVQTDPSQLGPDTIMVLHVDRASGLAALISVGRNNYCVPLPAEAAKHFATSANGCSPGTWPHMINALPIEVLGHCNYFPIPAYVSTCGQPNDPNRYIRAYRAFEETIGNLLGLEIDGSMWINPAGLTSVINDLGGVDINVPTTVYDKPCGPAPTWEYKVGTTIAVPGNGYCADAHNGYSVPTGKAGVANMIKDAANSGGDQSVVWQQGQDIAFIIKANPAPGPTQHMDGDWALAYARTRVYTNGGDFNRAGRQQAVLRALAADVDPCKFANPEGVVSLLSALQDIPYAFNSDLPITDPQDLQAWASLAKKVLLGNVASLVLDPTSTGEPSVNVPAGSNIWYPAVDPASQANIQGKVRNSLKVPAASASPSASTGATSC